LNFDSLVEVSTILEVLQSIYAVPDGLLLILIPSQELVFNFNIINQDFGSLTCLFVLSGDVLAFYEAGGLTRLANILPCFLDQESSSHSFREDRITILEKES